jgi:signal transduction histidine kinase
MMQTTVSNIFHLSLAVVYFLIAVQVMRKRGYKDLVTWLLVFYSLISVFMELIIAARDYLSNALALPEMVLLHIPYYGIFFLALIFLSLTMAFLHKESFYWVLIFAASIIFGIVLTLDFNWFGIPEILWRASGSVIYRPGVSFASLVLGWGICYAWNARVTFRSYVKAEKIVVKHRIAYWAFSLILSFGGGLLFLVQSHILSSILYVFGAIAAYLIITVHRLPDINLTIRRILSVVLVGTFELVIYAAGFWAIQTYLSDLVGYSPFLAGLFLALVLLICFNPLFRLTQRWVRKLIVGKDADPNQIARVYSQGINNIVDLNQLASVAIGLIKETLNVKGGVLFSVVQSFGEDGQQFFRLKGVPEMEDATPIKARIPLDSPIAIQLGEERTPLMQSEIDVLPRFRFLSTFERSWLNSQEMDMYIPIHYKGEWVGIFAIGPKLSGGSFSDSDIELLTILANQTAVALQNARLVDSLVRINNEFRRAYSSMEDANAKLAKIDRTKSDFICIASHELRTPLTVLSGYSQMLMDDTTINENDYYGKIIGGIYDGTTRLHEIIDSMLDVAKIDTRELELQAEPVHLQVILNEICQEHWKAFSDRDLTLDIAEMNHIPPVQGDPEALKKVFFHLVMNAIKYTPNGGQVGITGLEIDKGDTRFPPGGVEIVISDTGIGIDPRFTDLIFSKFYQTGELAFHSSGKTKFKGGGPGLGLAIVRGIIQAHGGRVWVESPGYDEDKNPGSHFHVLVPLSIETKVNPPGEINV